MGTGGHEESLEEILDDLPPELRQEVEDFARFLRDRQRRRSGRRLRLTWAGALRDLRDAYTSKELAEESMYWWET